MESEDLRKEGDKFGQREPLTRRIRTLLKEYPDGLSIPKELIQNADDAQATEACLLLDLRSHSSQNLINDTELHQFQGPAILFWNNKPFQESDFGNLCEFGGETKLENRKKIGKFGLGFNSVYNLTDLPQFVSKSSYCILDPHEKFFNGRGLRFDLTKTTKDGRSIADALQGHLEPFEDLFEFSREKVKKGQSFEGVIFRLPLRTSEHAKWSEIKKDEYTQESARDLIYMTAKFSDLFLIFLQFVNKFDICLIEKSKLDVKQIARFERSFRNDSNSAMAQVLCREDEQFCSNYQITIKDLLATERTFDWDIFVRSSDLRSKPDKTRCVGAIAFPSKDLKLESNTNNQLLFCFLPLPHPPSTGLPFLVNGSFAVTSSRRNLEVDTVDDRSEEKRIEGQWNRDILQRAAAPALCDAVLSKASTHTQDQLFNLFPNYSQEIERLTQLLSLTFYDRLTSDAGMKVFKPSKSEELVSFSDKRVIVISHNVPEEVRLSIMNCAPYSSSPDMWISLNNRVQNSVSLFFGERLKNKERNFTFFFTDLIKKAAGLFEFQRQDYITLVQHALNQSHCDFEIRQTLQKFPWVAVTSTLNGVEGEVKVKFPKQLVHPRSNAGELLYFTSNFFPSEQMNLTADQMSLMCQLLGMKTQILPKPAIPEVISNLNGMTAWSDIEKHFKSYARHLNTNEPNYTSAALQGEICRGLLIPKVEDEG
ncbi:sacsin-like [Convolutriloba macropyga]|uniref:sacsin-like n=1 Tax=Convolutriloba macropyga TaxID=536237 RepID=UPI003F525635